MQQTILQTIMCNIDISFDFQLDTPPGKDPDASSPTLRHYHKILWSKPLPNGSQFELLDTTPRVYLHHHSKIGEFWLSSDSIIASYSRSRDRKISSVIEQLSSHEVESFRSIGYTIGGMLIFPSNKINRKNTINVARGLSPQIKDRFDLTLECIRRHYMNESSPLENTLQRYADFFRLFESFRGYVEFFLLQDLVNIDFSEVKFFLPFDDFKTSPLPSNKEDYLAYKKRSIDFIDARNRRIQEFCKDNHVC
mgnify:CR=1 FL=1